MTINELTHVIKTLVKHAFGMDRKDLDPLLDMRKKSVVGGPKYEVSPSDFRLAGTAFLLMLLIFVGSLYIENYCVACLMFLVWVF